MNIEQSDHVFDRYSISMRAALRPRHLDYPAHKPTRFIFQTATFWSSLSRVCIFFLLSANIFSVQSTRSTLINQTEYELLFLVWLVWLVHEFQSQSFEN